MEHDEDTTKQPDPLVSLIKALEIFNDTRSDDAWKVAMATGVTAVALELRDIRNMIANITTTVANALEADSDAA